MIDLTHQRLQQSLIAITNLAETAGPQLPQGYFTSSITDVWVIIDCIHRLHGLITYIPNVPRKMRNPAIRNFLTNAKKVNEFRNTVQHLDQTISQKAAVAQWSVWGSLGWAIVYPGDIIKTSSFFAGFMEQGEKPLLNPLGKAIRLPVGLITLWQENLSICISDLITDVERLAQELETSAAAAFDANPQLATTFASDVAVTMTFAPAAQPGHEVQ
jgi:hypothetical protein